MRGAVSLAIALSLPATLDGDPFTDRGGLIFVAGVVVMVTLVGQGATLPWLLRRLGLTDAGTRRREYLRAEYEMDCAAVRKVDELLTAGDMEDETADVVRERYSRRIGRLQKLLDAEEGDLDRIKRDARDRGAMLGQIDQARRDALMALYRSGEIDHDVFTGIGKELDLRGKGGGLEP